MSKPERVRMREPREEHEPSAAGVVPGDPGRMFAQLFANDEGESGYATGLPGAVSSADRVMIEALAEQLAPRIQGGTQWPLHAVLYLPRLGRINARVERAAGVWYVELDAEEERTSRWLGGVRKRCQDRLAEGLGQPVELSLRHVDSA